jgi:hypothetical protein
MVAPSSAARIEWVLLSYRVPREPSTPRIAIWRRLKRLGVAQISDGLVALPLDARSREQLEWVAEDVTDNDGAAAIWIGVLASSIDERRVASELASNIAREYAAISEEASTSMSLPPVARRSALRKLRRRLRLVRLRDYFPPPEREVASQAVDELASLVEAAV